MTAGRISRAVAAGRVDLVALPPVPRISRAVSAGRMALVALPLTPAT